MGLFSLLRSQDEISAYQRFALYSSFRAAIKVGPKSQAHFTSGYRQALTDNGCCAKEEESKWVWYTGGLTPRCMSLEG